MRRSAFIALILASGAFAGSVALKPICPECGSSDNVVIAEDVSEDLGLKVYVCLVHEIYYIRDAKYISYKWHSEEDIPEIKAEYTRIDAERTAAREEKIARLKAGGWPDDTIDRVLDGLIRIGDPPEIVREAWGPPGEIHQEDTPSGPAEIWFYTEFDFDRRWVRFEDGKVRQYKNLTVRGE
jgi:hypothetical protein